MKVYIILPAYNEEPSIEKLLRRIKDEIRTLPYEFKLIVVNDGSSDNTLREIAKHCAGVEIDVIHHKYNRGLGETSRDAFERAAELCSDDDIIIRMDCDDTHHPKYITPLIDKIKEGNGVAICSRFQKGGGAPSLNAYRAFISRCANVFMKVFFPINGVWEYSCGYRAYAGWAVKRAIEIFGDSFIELRGLGFTGTLEKLVKFKMMGVKMAEIPFTLYYDRKKSTSKMITSITTLGYLVLALKYVYPWGKPAKKWKEKIKEMQKNGRMGPNGSRGRAGFDDVAVRTILSSNIRNRVVEVPNVFAISFKGN